MYNKSNLLLLILFTLTVGVVGWLGYKLTSQQDQQIKMSQINRSEQSLDLVQNNISNYLNSKKQQLSEFIDKTPSEIDDNINRNPLIHHVIIFNKAKELIYPDDLSSQKHIIASQWLDSITVEQETSQNQVTRNNWFIWYDQQKEKYIFWQENTNKILLIEINNAMFMAEFIHYLAGQPNRTESAYLQIIDNSGRIFYQWGESDILNNADFDIQKSLVSPLSGWSLRYYSQIESLSSLSKGLFQIVVIGMLILLSIITFILIKLKQREQLEAQQRLSFINQVSHELKTPLTNIRLHGDLLERSIKEKPDNQNARQSITIIQQESERLSRLINNVLNFNKLEKDTLKLHYTNTDFNDLLQQAILPFMPAFEQHNINVEIDNKVLESVTVDSDVVKQIIGNLLSNIEKYANSSEIIRISSDNDTNGNINIIVQDEGNGIPNNVANKVFEPFYRMHSHLTDAAGSGLGLGLARELARLHGGDLTLLKSKQGAKFKISIEDQNA